MINPIIAQIQKEIWMMEQRSMAAYFANVFEIDAESLAKLAAIEISKTKPALKVENGTATINIHGILMKNPPSWLAWFGIESTDYAQLRSQLAEALGNKAVQSIMLHVDSPGGTVAGSSEAAEAIAAANKIKPVSAYVEDLGASAAYYLASQAGQITANPNAEVGSIGVFTVYDDFSKAAEMQGVKVHVIRSGEHKGMGVIGAPITDEQIEAMQAVIDGMADNFIKAVGSGRKMKAEQVRELATGQVWIAKEAKKLGLIDGIANGIENLNLSNNSSKENVMAETQEKETGGKTVVKSTAQAPQKPAKKPATVAELKEAFADEPAFCLEQFEAGATLLEAKAAYAEVLKKRNAELSQQNAELKKNKDKKGRTGTDPIVSGGEGAAGGEDFIQAAADYAEEHKCTRTEAMRKVKKAQPELHAAYIRSCMQKKERVKGDDKD